MVPTWYIFIEEALPVLCPITHLLAKALAEGVIESEGYQSRAEPFFATKKKEWLHEPVFRKTVRTEISEMDVTQERVTALYKLVRLAGKELKRHGGMWKKPERCPSGEHNSTLPFLQNKTPPFKTSPLLSNQGPFFRNSLIHPFVPSTPYFQVFLFLSSATMASLCLGLRHET